jgi:EmrB/QacA subfamily drug resistance transporter
VAPIAPAVLLVIGMVAAINLAIPTLQASSLHPSVSETAWVIDSYTLVFACLLIPAGALGDRFRRKRGMLIGLGVFALGSALAAVAPSVPVLMGARALSGLGAAMVLPATLAVTLGRVVAPERPQAIAFWSALSGVGGAIGNLAGGLAVQAGGWRALFWEGVPIAIAAAALIAARVPEETPHRDPVDCGGGVLLTAGTVALLYGIIEAPQHGWGSWQVLGSLAFAAVLLAAFAWLELHFPHPMVDPRLFRLAGVRVGTLGILVLFFVLFGLFYINAQYLQDVKGFTAVVTGVCLLPIALAMLYASVRSMRLVAQVGMRATVLIGMVAVAVGIGLLSFATAATPYPLFGLALVIVGGGIGLAMPPLSAMIVAALPPSRAGVASGLNSTIRETGSALGVAVFSSILVTRFADRLPAVLRTLPGAGGDAVRHSVAAALQRSEVTGDPELRTRLIDGTRDAFTSGTSLGLRVSAVLLLLTAAAVALQHPKKSKEGTS